MWRRRTVRSDLRRRAAVAPVAAVVSVAVIGAACAAPIDVATERSDRFGGPLEQVDEPAESTGTPSGATIDWTSCDSFSIPDPEFLGTSRWECARLAAPMDPFDADAADETVQLALTRHRATGVRQGTLLVNPGGPGGVGLEFAWSIRPAFPAELLRSFDIVAWDPRGVGQSTPTISCGVVPDFDDDFLMTTCAEETGSLAAHLAAPYSAGDMEAIRIGLGEPRLDYLGYSYGSTLGAAYAARYPDTVGKFVLDGVTDPLIGSVDGEFEDGFPYYASDGVPAASDRFAELCDATDRCQLGADSALTIEQLVDRIDELPTDAFDGAPETVDADMFVELMLTSLGYAGDWELLATALADAADGDASAIASIVAFDAGLQGGEASGESGEESADGVDADPFDVANVVIYCADFRHVISDWSYCDGLPENAEPLRPVERVDTATPILVIGTDFDPSTPGKHAPEFAAELGEAVAISWAGVGHTAFPAPTRCIDDAVVDYLIDGLVPEDGLACQFLDDVGPDATDEELAEVLFAHGDAESERLLINVFEFGIGADRTTARCAAQHVNELDDRTISHVVLAVASDDADQAVSDALASC